MSPERWERVAEVFEAAHNCALAERPRLLRTICGDDEELRGEVETLLRSAEAASGFLSAGPELVTEGAAAPQLAVGTLLAERFEIGERLGRGGMGEVYAARDRALGIEVALKLVRPEIAGDPRALGRFKREVLTARRISHPNVCRIHDFASELGGESGRAFLTMELIAGETLAERLQRAPPPSEGEARGWLGQIAAGLDAAHAAGVIHRDFKPANVMLAGDRAVITDFGLARPVASASLDGASASRLIGTLAYMAPEQLAGGEATAASDLYAFGLVAYELLTGKRAYGGSGPFAGVLQRLHGPFEAPSVAHPGLDAGWDRVIAGCLAESQADRFPSASAAMAALENAAAAGAKPRRAKLTIGNWQLATAAATVAAMALGWGFYRYHQWQPQVAAGTEILLTPVINATQDAQLDATTVALRQELAQSAQFQLTSDADVRAQFQRMNRPADSNPAMLNALAQQPALARQVAMRRGAPLVVFASLSRLAGEYRIDLEVDSVGHDPDAAAHRWSHSETASGKADLFDGVHAAANWVRTLLGEQPQALASTDQPPQDITTASWEALAYYSRAEAERAAYHTPEAIALLRQATAVDPSFALAYARLADILVSRQEWVEAYADYRRAIKLSRSRRLSQREALRLEGIYDGDVGDNAGAVHAFQSYAALYPNDFVGWFYQGLPQMQLGHSESALAAWKRAEALQPTILAIPNAIAQFELWLGDPAAAQAARARALKLNVPGYAEEVGAKFAFTQGDLDTADGLLSKLQTANQPAWRSLAALMRADELAEQGRYAQARSVLQAGIAIDRADGTLSESADKHIALAYLDLKLNQRDGIAHECEQALAQDNSLKSLGRCGAMLAQSGQLAAAGQALNQARAARDLQPLQSVVADHLQGEILLAEGNVPGALTAFRAADRASGALDDDEYVARGLAAAGEPRAALDIYKIWASNPARVWYLPGYFPPGWFADLTYQAARLSDQLHQADARARWQHYLQLRAHGDADLPEVTRARQRLMALAAIH